MCLLICNTTGAIPKENLLKAWTRNNDGAGLAWPEDDEVKILKFPTIDGFEAFYDAYLAVRQRIKRPILVHFRISTSGFDDKFLHPFAVGEEDGKVKMVVGHNGVIDTLSEYSESDTYLLAEILKRGNLTGVSQIKDNLVEIMEDLIGYSKLLFLDSKGGIRLINPKYGHWDVNMGWFSNDSYKITKTA